MISKIRVSGNNTPCANRIPIWHEKKDKVNGGGWIQEEEVDLKREVRI